MSLIYGYEEKGATGSGGQVEANKESIEDKKNLSGMPVRLREILT